MNYQIKNKKPKLFWIRKNRISKEYDAFYRNEKGIVIVKRGFVMKLQAKRYIEKMLLKQYFGEE